MSDALALAGFEDAGLLQDSFLFRFLNFDESILLKTICHRRFYRAGSTIVDQDSVGDAMYVVASGEVEVRRSGRTLATLDRGDLFGEMSLIDNDLTSASCTARTDTELLVLQREEYEGFLRQHPAMEIKIYKAFCSILSARLRQANSELDRLRG